MTEIIQAKASHIIPLVDLFDAYRIFYRKASDKKKAKDFLLARIASKESIIYLSKDTSSNTFSGFTQLYPLFSSTRMRRVWLLNDLYVLPEYRGRGISKLLIEQSKELARQTDAVGLMLETEKSNTIGNQLYPSTDFQLNEETNFYFWINE